jgi:PAS domain S-box-containing protein
MEMRRGGYPRPGMKQPEENYRLLFETMNEGYALYEIVYDEFRNPVDYIVVDFNPAFESLTGLKKEKAIGQKASLLYRNTRPPHPEVFARVADTGEPAYFETYFPVVQKHFGISVFSPGKGRLATLFSDVSERKQSEEELKRDEARLESLLKLSEYKSTDVKGLLDFALDEAIKLTGSRAGYIYFYDEAQKEFALNTWAENGIEECQILNPQTLRQLENTSMWGEVVRQRKPIVRNDYRSSRPLKKGYPEGHVELERFLAVPVFIRDKVAAVAGVANKPSEYLQSDIRQLTLLMDTVGNR